MPLYPYVYYFKVSVICDLYQFTLAGKRVQNFCILSQHIKSRNSGAPGIRDLGTDGWISVKPPYHNSPKYFISNVPLL